MSSKEKIREFINSCKEDLEKEKLSDGDYCVLVLTLSADYYNPNMKVKKVYKNLAEFEAKVERDCEKIDPMFGINFQLWIFD